MTQFLALVRSSVQLGFPLRTILLGDSQHLTIGKGDLW